jgi:hypothetical protein
VLLVGAGRAFPGARDLEQRGLVEIAADELDRERQPARDRPAIIASAGWPVTLNGVRAWRG